EPVGRVRDEPQEGRSRARHDQVDHRLRRVRRPAGQHRRPRPPLRPVVVGDYKKGQEVDAVVLAIDVERERISLGIKQLEGDPFSNFVAIHDKGSIVSGTVKSLDPKGAVVSLGGDIEGYLRASEVSRDRVEDIRTRLKEGDNVSAMIINVDRKNRSINLSIKAKDNADESEAMQRMSAENAGTSTGTTNLGALLKAKLDNKANG